jgi:hypothetical protein
MASYEIWLGTDRGVRLALLDTISSLTYLRAVNAVGQFSLTLPANYDIEALIAKDRMIEVWRNGVLRLAGFVLKPRYYQNIDGVDLIELSGPDSNDLLNRRIVAYAAGSAQASQTNQADDLCKQVVRENLGASAIAARDWTSLGFTVAADVALGPSITKGFAWKNTLATLQAIVATAWVAGTRVYFDVVPVPSSPYMGFEFRTYINQRGADRTYAGGTPTVFGPEWGNLEAPDLTYDYSNEATYVYGGGQGEGPGREIIPVSDATRLGQSVWGRREAFADASNEASTAGVTAKANQRLREGAPMTRFTGALKDTDQTRFGLDWDFGDAVVCSYRGRQFDAIVNTVKVSLDGNGQEKIEAKAEVIE